jgi:hypothetical protein
MTTGRAADGWDTNRGDVTFWDARTREEIGGPIQGYGAAWGLDFSEDGQMLASGGDYGSTYLHDATSWSEEPKLLRERLCTVAGRNLSVSEWREFLPGSPIDPHAPICLQPAQLEPEQVIAISQRISQLEGR